MRDTIIVGGGLSGLATAVGLARAGRDVRVLEGRDRLGGRILSRPAGDGRVELGPAWTWPGQPRVAALAEAAGSRRIVQYDGRHVLWAQGLGAPRRVPFDVHMGATRIAEGLSSWIDYLAGQLPPEAVRLGARVRGLRDTGGGIEVELEGDDVERAAHVVLAMPPRLIAGLELEPALPPNVQAYLPTVSTWMAGEAKVVVTYARDFWRPAGLSGDGLGTRGPLGQIYEASAPGRPALGGFVGLDAPARAELGREGLAEAVVTQLAALFGPEAASPLEVLVHDWTQDDLTATRADIVRPGDHPDYRPPFDLAAWNGRLVLSGTELAPEFGGYLEGALAASEDALARLGGGAARTQRWMTS